MVITSCGSSSKGNTIVVNGDIILDCGISPDKVLPKINFNIPKIAVVTHVHQDHSKYINKWASRGVTIIVPCTMTGNHREYVINEHQWIDIHGYKVYAFPSIHDVKCFGYLIDFPNGERLCYNVDTKANIYSMQGISHYVTECNYDDESIEKSHYSQFLKQRIVDTHKSLKTLLNELDNMDKSLLQEIYIAHLSDSNSNEELIKTEVQKHTGILTTIL